MGHAQRAAALTGAGSSQHTTGAASLGAIGSDFPRPVAKYLAGSESNFVLHDWEQKW
jgi:hypothetical protein